MAHKGVECTTVHSGSECVCLFFLNDWYELLIVTKRRTNTHGGPLATTCHPRQQHHDSPVSRRRKFLWFVALFLRWIGERRFYNLFLIFFKEVCLLKSVRNVAVYCRGLAMQNRAWHICDSRAWCRLRTLLHKSANASVNPSLSGDLCQRAADMTKTVNSRRL